MMRAICVQRLWLDGKVSSAWTGYSLEKALRWIESIPRELRPRLWIEAEKQPSWLNSK